MAATNINATDYFSPARWVVSTVAGQGTHSTITAATSAASAGDTIVLMDYVATEDVAMKTGVNYTAFTGASNELTSQVTGKWSYSGAGTVTISNIALVTNSDNFLAITGSSASIVYLQNCYLNALNNTGITFSSSSSSALIRAIDCLGDIGTTSIGMHTMSSTGTLRYTKCYFTNSGGSTTVSNNSAGTTYYEKTNFNSSVGTSSTGASVFFHSLIQSNINNSIAFTSNGTGNSQLFYSFFSSGTASAISTGSGATTYMYYNTLISSNTDAITGAGTVLTIGTAFGAGSTTKSNVTTQTGGVAQGLNQGTAPSAGYIGEQIRSQVSSTTVTLSNTTAADATTISLTAGIWDVSGIVEYAAAAITGTVFSASINTSTAVGTAGDNWVLTPTAPTTLCDLSLSIPSYRITLASTTTIHLVAYAAFTVGTLKCGGRISATRVG